jgi:uncharacterized membrane protein HdeD (DUF308 family)
MAIDPAGMKRASSSVNSLQAHWKFFLGEGIVLCLLGVAAMVLTPLAALAVELMVGWVLLFSGIAGLISTFGMRHATGFAWSLLSAIAAIVAGALLLCWPQNGVLTLTVILSVFLFLEGLISLLFALDHRRDLSGRWGLLLISGIVDLVLAGIIFFGLPGTASWAVGTLVAINLLMGGSALIAMALHARKAPSGN